LEFLAQERRTLESFLPGFDERLAAIPLGELEAPDSEAVEMFRETGGPGLLVPAEHRGMGAGPLDGIRIQRALGARSPSLAVATTMHHFSTATLVELWRVEKGLEWMLLQGIAEQNVLLASGFAEGNRDQGVLSPTMRGRRVDGKVLISGTKKPCSLSRSMDILTASVKIDGDGDDDGEFAVALISSQLPGIEVSPFWAAPVLTGAQSDAISLEDVAVEDDLVVTIKGGEGDDLDQIQNAGFLWFELLISASYLGMASALVERVLRERRGEPSVRLAAAAELEAAMASLEGIARAMTAEGAPSDDLLSRALLCRYAAQDAIARAVASAVEQLGGMAFIGGQDVTYFASASRALAFHPPPRARTAESIVDALTGAELELA
jgi:alkylation response protein AidB-like acyl-CoA dehydrogenase